MNISSAQHLTLIINAPSCQIQCFNFYNTKQNLLKKFSLRIQTVAIYYKDTYFSNESH
jgi:hypothetical protein